MPVFWPVIESSLMAIFVTKEVHVERHLWLGGNTFEGDGISMRSTTDSQAALNGSSGKGAGVHEMKPYAVDFFTPAVSEEQIEAQGPLDGVAKQNKSGATGSWLDVS